MKDIEEADWGALTFNKIEKEVTFNTEGKQAFELREVVYASSLNQYVLLKEFKSD